MITIEDIRTELGEGTRITKKAVGAVLAAEHAQQRSVCNVPTPRPVELDDALLRRVMVNLEQTGGKAPVRRLGSTDDKVRALEAPYSRRSPRQQTSG